VSGLQPETLRKAKFGAANVVSIPIFLKICSTLIRALHCL
jgi:hypothetical protein